MSRIDDDRRILEAATEGRWYPAATDDQCYMNARYVTTTPNSLAHDNARGMDAASGDEEPESVVCITLLQSPALALHAAGRWDEDAVFIANAHNRDHLYHALARAVQDAIDVPFNSSEWHAKARAITVALADIEAPEEVK